MINKRTRIILFLLIAIGIYIFTIFQDKIFSDRLLRIDDTSNKRETFISHIEFVPYDTYGIERDDHGVWSQGIAHIDSGFYLMSQNIKEKNKENKYVEKYILFNLFDSDGKSIGNAEVDYASHGQDLSIVKISQNNYYLYSASPKNGKIARFKFNTKNIDFINPIYNKKLDITYDKEILMNKDSKHITASLNEKKNLIVCVGYSKKKKNNLNISIHNSKNYQMLKSFYFDLDRLNNGFYTQGVAMSKGKIYLLRGHWFANDKDNKPYSVKKLFVIDAKKGKILNTYSFKLEDTLAYKKIEPEGLTIVNDNLFVCLPTKDNNNLKKIRLFKLLDGV